MAVNPVAVIRNNKGWLLQCGDDHPRTLFAVHKVARSTYYTGMT